MAIFQAAADPVCDALFALKPPALDRGYDPVDEHIENASRALALADYGAALTSVEAALAHNYSDSPNVDLYPHAAFFALKSGNVEKFRKYLAVSEGVVRLAATKDGCNGVDSAPESQICGDIHDPFRRDFVLRDQGFLMRVGVLKNGLCLPD